jgi:hypothetical protein
MSHERSVQRRSPACLASVARIAGLARERPAPSSRGLGHHPLKVETRVRTPLGLPLKFQFRGPISLADELSAQALCRADAPRQQARGLQGTCCSRQRDRPTGSPRGGAGSVGVQRRTGGGCLRQAARGSSDPLEKTDENFMSPTLIQLPAERRRYVLIRGISPSPSASSKACTPENPVSPSAALNSSSIA